MFDINKVGENVVVGVVTAFILGIGTIIWAYVSNGGFVHFLGGVTLADVRAEIQNHPGPLGPPGPKGDAGPPGKDALPESLKDNVFFGQKSYAHQQEDKNWSASGKCPERSRAISMFCMIERGPAGVLQNLGITGERDVHCLWANQPNTLTGYIIPVCLKVS